MSDGTRMFRVQLPSGKITPLGLLAFAGFLFDLSVRNGLMTWHRIVFVCIGGISVVLCLLAFGGKLPCKRRVRPRCQNDRAICPRDLGFASGLALTILVIVLLPKPLWDAAQSGWRQLGVARFFCAASLALPTVVQGTIRRIANVQTDDKGSTRVMLFVFGLLNALIAVAWFLERRGAGPL